MFTVSSTFFRVGSGCTVTVFGGVFTPNCKAVIGGVEYAPLDVGEDFSLLPLRDRLAAIRSRSRME